MEGVIVAEAFIALLTVSVIFLPLTAVEVTQQFFVYLLFVV